MTAREGKNNARKEAIRDLQKANPGMGYLEAGKLLDTGTDDIGEYDAIANGFDVKLNLDKLDFSLSWTTHRNVRVTADPFDDNVTDEHVARMFAVMALWPQHTFQLLTEHPQRMLSILTKCGHGGIHTPGTDFRSAMAWAVSKANPARLPGSPDDAERRVFHDVAWPLPNVWLGTSIRNQQQADASVPALLQTPAALRFVGIEPRGPVDLVGRMCRDCMRDMEAPQCDKCYDRWWVRPGRSNRIDWVTAGGGEGPDARPLHLDWVLALRDQCVVAEVPFLFTQWGQFAPSGNPARDQRYLVHHDGISAPFNGAAVAKPGIGQQFAYRVGVKRAGRLLDGRTWDQRPDTVVQ
ncbi:DUF5131 family protein [Mycobacteroides abscessus]|uniref:DUF5131 family protein n=1 Tax=Mycobacteroides abscessus TaxID=36809 RepID=UPI0009A61D57|nr:DUF5131 family protein [Mycobacteroides abscessus]SKK34544.1 bacteriophage protein gp37 [Mycobacteroides abscessus subsp. abscessus]